MRDSGVMCDSNCQELGQISEEIFRHVNTQFSPQNSSLICSFVLTHAIPDSESGSTSQWKLSEQTKESFLTTSISSAEFEFDLFIRPDTCNPRFRVWFNFTVENVRADQRVIFNIVNFSKTKSLYRDGMSPLVKSSSR